MNEPCIATDWKLCVYGYGKRSVGGKTLYAHRVAWEAVNGAIPVGLVIDHLCFNRACVNVNHMRVVTQSENAKNQQRSLTGMCAKGHPRDEANLYLVKVGKYVQRNCRACTREYVRAYKQRKRDAA